MPLYYAASLQYHVSRYNDMIYNQSHYPDTCVTSSSFFITNATTDEREANTRFPEVTASARVICAPGGFTFIVKATTQAHNS